MIKKIKCKIKPHHAPEMYGMTGEDLSGVLYSIVPIIERQAHGRATLDIKWDRTVDDTTVSTVRAFIFKEGE